MRAKLGYALLLVFLLLPSSVFQATAQWPEARRSPDPDGDASYGGTVESRKKGIIVEDGIADTRKMPYYVERENDLVYWAREHYGSVSFMHLKIHGQRVLVVLGNLPVSTVQQTIQVYGWHEKAWRIKWIGFVSESDIYVGSDGLNLQITNSSGKTLLKTSASTL